MIKYEFLRLRALLEKHSTGFALLIFCSCLYHFLRAQSYSENASFAVYILSVLAVLAACFVVQRRRCKLPPAGPHDFKPFISALFAAVGAFLLLTYATTTQPVPLTILWVGIGFLGFSLCLWTSRLALRFAARKPAPTNRDLSAKPPQAED